MARSQVLLKLAVLTAATFILTVIGRLVLRDVLSLSTAQSFPGRTNLKTNLSIQLPYRGAVRSVEEIFAAQWVSELGSYLASLESRHVSLCIADSRYKSATINWLVSALVAVRPPLENVLVVSLDRHLRDFLQRRDLDSIFMDPHTILKDDVELHSSFSHIWVTRVVLFRLLNHWGYSVATYDSDAVLVKNPQPLFTELEESDVVGSPGIYPFDLYKQWKSPTLCMGVVLFRASEKTERFWGLLSDVQFVLGVYDDQVVVNKALNQCGIVWSVKSTPTSSVHGTCHNPHLRVSLLPASAICRNCKNQGGEYVWHQKGKRGEEFKMKVAEGGGMWLLKPGQDLNEGDLKGIEWLRHLYSK